jgi:hypothetical protein
MKKSLKPKAQQPTSNLYYYIKTVRGSLPPPGSAFNQSTPSIYIHQIITVRLVASASSLLHPSIATAPLSTPLFLDRSSIKLHPCRRRQRLRPSHATVQPPLTLLPTPLPLPRPTLPARLHGHLEADSASPCCRPTKARNPLGEASAPPKRERGGEQWRTYRPGTTGGGLGCLGYDNGQKQANIIPTSKQAEQQRV